MRPRAPLLILFALQFSRLSIGAEVEEANAPPPQEEKKWGLDLSLYGLAAGMSGDVTVHGIKGDVDVGFDDILENLNLGAMGSARFHYQRWALNLDVVYMDLEVEKQNAKAEFAQWMVEPSLGFTICDYFEALAGARYNNLDGSLRFTGPLGNVRQRSGTVDWWDPIIGGKVAVPIVGGLSAKLRADVGGFGVGSDLTWQVFPFLNWQVARWFSLQAGYRWLYNDYDEGSGNNLFRYDILTQGPQFGLTFSF